MHNNYATLQEAAHDQDEQGILYHVAEPTRSKWSHIDDLDSFFTRMYKYHQKHGFLCLLLQEIFELGQFLFIVILTTYLFHGINYPILFHYSNARNGTKITLHDIIFPVSECIHNFSFLTWCIIIISLAVLVFKFFTKFYQTIYYWDIKQFYNTALKINDDELDNLTWCDIISKIKEVQLEQQMCIHKRELTELDIYHRILRQENYMVAMVNKHLLPPRIRIPFIGEIVYWTKPLRYNIQGLLFRSPWSPFESPWHLREEYKKQNLRNELANKLGRYIIYLALINLCLFPIIFLWQILYNFYSYGDLIKREPGRMGIRNWSLYSKLYFRHFNELDHELQARLTRAYRPASRYLEAFSSPVMTVIAQYVGFMCGSLFTVIVALTIYDEDVIAVEHVLSIMTALGAITAICRSLIPDERTIWCPEQLLECVVMHTHYLPTDWKGQAHTSRVRENFQELFQMSVVAILEDLLSPILTPYLMIRWVYPRSLEIVDFFRNFTVSVVGVGDVCSFAEMNVKKHGNPLWQMDPYYYPSTTDDTDQYLQAEDGKIELSLLHFTTTNPLWVPTPSAQEFIQSVEEQAGPEMYDSDFQLYSSQRYFEEEMPRREILRPTKPILRDSSSSKEQIDFRRESQDSSQDNFRRPIDKSTVWFDDTNLQNLHKSVTWLEGPNVFSSANMRKSAMTLHTRRARNTRSLEETTPLLSVRNK
ncbi:autophagy-related protein 9A [Diorhabda sublineata]|uniref:autophagy-related protein 9A n=1 Tax=Diorhabda sublineata TaxID=1163346 RepID=UPI0024E07141|nr:autophagy-related protein 9A [Diorhabda sublineata]